MWPLTISDQLKIATHLSMGKQQPCIWTSSKNICAKCVNLRAAVKWRLFLQNKKKYIYINKLNKWTKKPSCVVGACCFLLLFFSWFISTAFDESFCVFGRVCEEKVCSSPSSVWLQHPLTILNHDKSFRIFLGGWKEAVPLIIANALIMHHPQIKRSQFTVCIKVCLSCIEWGTFPWWKLLETTVHWPPPVVSYALIYGLWTWHCRQKCI